MGGEGREACWPRIPTPTPPLGGRTLGRLSGEANAAVHDLAANHLGAQLEFHPLLLEDALELRGELSVHLHVRTQSAGGGGEAEG